MPLLLLASALIFNKIELTLLLLLPIIRFDAIRLKDDAVVDIMVGVALFVLFTFVIVIVIVVVVVALLLLLSSLLLVIYTTYDLLPLTVYN